MSEEIAEAPIKQDLSLDEIIEKVRSVIMSEVKETM